MQSQYRAMHIVHRAVKTTKITQRMHSLRRLNLGNSLQRVRRATRLILEEFGKGTERTKGKGMEWNERKVVGMGEGVSWIGLSSI